jgi:hypothetical protein
MTQKGPTQAQVDAWLKELEGLQVSINNSNLIDSKVYVKSMLNVMSDLVESFKNEPPSPMVCRKCGCQLSQSALTWDLLCQGCFDRIVGTTEGTRPHYLMM